VGCCEKARVSKPACGYHYLELCAGWCCGCVACVGCQLVVIITWSCVLAGVVVVWHVWVDEVLLGDVMLALPGVHTPATNCHLKCC
jgi:hypothetical protein